MMLKDINVRNAKPKEKIYRLFDGGGLYLEILPTGGKYWRMKYRFNGKEKRLAFGVYPDVTLADARERRSEARKAMAAGNDPAEVKKEAKRLEILQSENTFESIAREWHDQNKHTWVPKHSAAVLKRLEGDIFPKLGNRPVTEITAPELLSVLRIIEKRGALDLTRTIAQYCQRVFAYAIATGRGERNPAVDLRGALKTPVTKHHAHLKASDLPEYLAKLEAYDGTLQTKLALKMLLLTFAAPLHMNGSIMLQLIEENKKAVRIEKEKMQNKDIAKPAAATPLTIIPHQDNFPPGEPTKPGLPHEVTKPAEKPNPMAKKASRPSGL